MAISLSIKNLFILICAMVLSFQVSAHAELYVTDKDNDKAQSLEETVEPVAPVKSWKSHLHGDAEIPQGKFKAYYFDQTQKPVRATSEIVEQVSIQGAWQTKGIESRNFAAYWIGQFDFQQHTKKQFYFDISWSKVRLIIDGQLVPLQGEKAEYNFSAGSHVIEVEYVNGWHTVGFSMKMADSNSFHSEGDIADFFKTLDDRDYEIHFVGVYESKNSDGSIDVMVADRGKPVVLWLSSYDGIKWNILNKDDVFILGIVAASHSRAVTLDNQPEGVPFFYLNKYMGRYTPFISGCHCAGHSFHCEGESDILQLSDEFKTKFGHEINAVDMGYGLQRANSAKTPLDQEFSQNVLAVRKDVEKQKAECIKKLNPDFNTMFE